MLPVVEIETLREEVTLFLKKTRPSYALSYRSALIREIRWLVIGFWPPTSSIILTGQMKLLPEMDLRRNSPPSSNLSLTYTRVSKTWLLKETKWRCVYRLPPPIKANSWVFLKLVSG